MYYISIFPGKSPGPHCRYCVHVQDGLPRVCAPRVCIPHVFIPRASHVRACVCGVTAAGTVGAMGAMGACDGCVATGSSRQLPPRAPCDSPVHQRLENRCVGVCCAQAPPSCRQRGLQMPIFSPPAAWRHFAVRRPHGAVLHQPHRSPSRPWVWPKCRLLARRLPTTPLLARVVPPPR